MEQAMSIFAKAYGHASSDPNVKEVFDTLLTLGSLAQLYGIDSLIKQTWDYDGHVEHDIWWDALTKKDVGEFKQKLGAPNSDLGHMLRTNGIHDLSSFDAFMGKKSIATKIREIVRQLPDRDDLESYFAVLAGRDELFDEVPPEPWVDLWQLFFESSPGQNH